MKYRLQNSNYTSVLISGLIPLYLGSGELSNVAVKWLALLSVSNIGPETC
jgi:hypothetical protein